MPKTRGHHFRTVYEMTEIPEKKMVSKALEEDGKEFVKVVKDPRLTEAENAVLVERLSELREAYIELLLKKREKSHDRDFVAG